MQELAARDEDVEPRTGGQEADELRSRVDDLLKVVEEDEHSPVSDMRGKRSLRAECARSGRQNELDVADGCKPDPPHAVRIRVCRGRGCLQRQSSLSGSPRASQGDETFRLIRQEATDRP